MADELTPDQEFLMWIGICITTWAHVEEHLFEMCATVLSGPRVNAAIVYYRTPTLDSRLKLVGELVLAFLPKLERAEGGHDHPNVVTWNALRKDIEGQLGTRARIAHHPVMTHPNLYEVGDIFELHDLLEVSWLEIYTSEGEQLRGRGKPPKPLLIDDLKSHNDAVIDVATRLGHFRDHVLPKRAG
jgi:hypothetical protein